MALLLLVCMALVGVWEVCSNRSRRPFRPFQVTAEDFAGFHPAGAAWIARALPVQQTPIEPNLLAYEVRSAPGQAAPPKAEPLFVRLVHGYNLPDCMRIKGYTVELLAERSAADPAQTFQPGGGGRVQVWRLTSDLGDRAVWISSMLRAADGAPTDLDTRAMPFPRVGTPDDPHWTLRGLTWSSLRHPLRNFRLFLRSRWNSSRRDWLTFLRLRQPAWASDEWLTLVTATPSLALGADEEEAVRRHALAVHAEFLREFGRWGRRGGAAGKAAPAP